MSVEKKISKNGLVQLNSVGVERAERLVRYNSGEAPVIWGKSKFTHDDYEAWAADRQRQIEETKAAGGDIFSITHRDDGESRLSPTSTNVKIHPGKVYQVLRARIVGHWNYRKHSGQCLILDTETGREVYVPRDFVEAV